MSGDAKKKDKKAEKITYNKTVETLIAIWDVLMRYSSKEEPLSVSQIVNKLKENEDAENMPSANTVRRYLSNEKAVIDAVSPTHTLQAKNKPGISHAYVHEDTLHVVLENQEGLTQWKGDMAAIFETAAPVVPRYNTIANLLKSYPQDGEQGKDAQALPPVYLKCVVARSGKRGRYIPYHEWADTYVNVEDIPKNKTRYYYLESALSKAEWKILADAVKVYPYITRQQTRKLLSALKRLNPGKDAGAYYMDDRYAFKHDLNMNFFKIVDILDAAIRDKKVLVVEYGRYVLECVDGKWTPVLQKLESKSELTGSYGNWRIAPYDLLWSNGYYYLVGKNLGYGWMNLRVDRILKVTPQNETFEKSTDFIPSEYRDRSPVMYPGDPKHIRLRCELGMVNTLLDVFGAKLEFQEPKDGYVEVTMNVAPKGVKLFVMEYADRVEALEPKELRDNVRESLKAALNTYK